MRDKVNIAMYLVYLSWTVRKKIVTNKQGQVQAPILEILGVSCHDDLANHVLERPF